MSTRVKLTNYYPDRTNSAVEIVPTPDDLNDLEDWWEDDVFPLTGDGFGESQIATYEAVVIASDVPELVGRRNAWEG